MKPHEQTWLWDENMRQVLAITDEEFCEDGTQFKEEDGFFRRVIVETDSGCYPPRWADRELIVAAPELARALLAVVDDSNDDNIGDFGEYLMKLRATADAALRKAGVR